MEVREGSLAEDSGLIPGDRLLSIDSQTMESPEQVASLVEAAREAERAALLARIERKEVGEIYLALQIE